MRNHNAKKRKTVETAKEARKVKEHLEALDFDYEMYAQGYFTEKSPKEGTPWHCNTGKGTEIVELGYKYAYVNHKGDKHKIKPEKGYSRPGKIEFYIY